MIHRLFLLSTGMLLLAGCESQDHSNPVPGPSVPGATIDPDPGPPPQGDDGPRLVFTADGHDFGPMEKNERAKHIAVFYNAGRAPLTITKVKTHCGCAAALLSATTIEPGGRGTLLVSLDSGTLAGRRVKTVEVVTNSKTVPVAKYPISFTVIADALLDPMVLVVRATRAAGEVKAHFDVHVMRPDLDLVIKQVKTSDPDLTATVVPLPPESKQAGYRVHLSFGPTFNARDFSERVTVYTNSKRDPRLTLTVIGSVRQTLLVVPERLYYPRLAPGEAVTRSIFVNRDDGQPLTVTAVTDSSGLFESEMIRLTAGKWEIKVTIAGEALEHTVRGSLVIETDAPKEPRVAVPFEVPGKEDE